VWTQLGMRAASKCQKLENRVPSWVKIVAMTDGAMIEVRGLSRRFGDAVAVDGLDLTVGRGEVFGFLGPNGAGKTTTIQMLCGLLRPTSGAVQIAGVDWQDDADAVRRSFAYAPDTAPLYEYLTVAEYCDFVASLYGVVTTDRVEPFLRALDLWEHKDKLCKSLSHGMRKKAHLCAILGVAPPLLVLDEPTNGLDPQGTRAFKDLIMSLSDQGTTVFLSTHVLDVVEEVADRIGVLVKGKLMACGSLQELQKGDASGSLERLFLELAGGAE